jgi:hypothetical protein
MRCFVFSALAGLVACSHSLGADLALLNDTLANHESSIGVIQRLHAKAALTLKSQFGSHVITAECWKDGSTLRVKENWKPGSTIDCVFNGETQTILAVDDPGEHKPFSAGMRSASRHVQVLQCDPWQLSLMVLPTVAREPPFRVMTLAEAAKTRKVTNVRKVVVDGRGLVNVSLASGDGKEKDEVWLDPSVNCLIRKVTRTTVADLTWKHEYTIAEFVEYKPGLYFPRRATATHEMNGKLARSDEIELTDVEINPAQMPSPPPLPIPRPGVRVLDEINGKVYWVDGNGRPTDSGSPLRFGKSIALPKPDPNAPPRQDNRLALPMGVGFGAIMIGAVGYGIFWRHKRRNHP